MRNRGAFREVRVRWESCREDPEALRRLQAELEGDPRRQVRLLRERIRRRLEAAEREAGRLDGLWVLEREAARDGFVRVAGVDESGRGPLAGPVVAAAVVLPPGFAIDGLNDCKLVPAQERPVLAREIRRRALAVGVGWADPPEIDRLNIHRASRLAMRRAVETLSPPPDCLLIDALEVPELVGIPQRAYVKGDARSASIAAASLVAKVHRDRRMALLSRRRPGYGLERHKGYATPEHLEALERLGVSPDHRYSFAPVRAVLQARWGDLAEHLERRAAEACSQAALREALDLLGRLASGLEPPILGRLRVQFRRRAAELGFPSLSEGEP